MLRGGYSEFIDSVKEGLKIGMRRFIVKTVRNAGSIFEGNNDARMNRAVMRPLCSGRLKSVELLKRHVFKGKDQFSPSISVDIRRVMKSAVSASVILTKCTNRVARNDHFIHKTTRLFCKGNGRNVFQGLSLRDEDRD